MALSFDPFTELDRLAGTLLSQRQGPKAMPVDLYREGDQYVLAADLPGIDPGSVDVDVDGQLLTITARRTAGDHAGATWLAQERPHGSYRRQFSLGDGVDTEGITANYDNGVLSVVIPVSQRAKPRRIEVGSARSGDGGAQQLSASPEAATA
ncbi:HSP20 family protein [Frigoribacterium sp. PvP120]|jgi:HSP20 family protein|uniref:Hsp20/alpha crystallin family protein n=1 Tax=Frigoribacterium TaxID=96492 RepID=UPI000700C369|nr:MULTISPECIES: Hsp20/alpha crystallin family protein [Frigoribacterium]KQR46161.1 heat-shock protein Hsp20 [Frigoribacterium sp. Leaf164]MBD8661035.1 Hsp20/alpha crystallin family protein [Frigoribacterium sp. CFBP 8754]MBD8728762.1 Hsp20/alpha crystallin family protein [Frigoribacterium sp. CFBP 13707]MBP1240844.1 HSP20 family protein [Frigoribacterium sp. PvP121]NII49724.1 HSP20 family protein [Frigoribacterium endophyticum]